MFNNLHLHLPSSRPLAHKALIRWYQLLLFCVCVCVLAWLHDVHPSCSLSFSTVLLHVVFGLPTLRAPSGVHLIAVAQWLLWSILSTCPIQLHLLSHHFTTSLCLPSFCQFIVGDDVWPVYLVSPAKAPWIETHLFSCCLLPSFSTSGCRTVPLAGPVSWTALFRSFWSIRKSSMFYSVIELFLSLCLVLR